MCMDILIDLLCNWICMFTIYLHLVQFFLKICMCYDKYMVYAVTFFNVLNAFCLALLYVSYVQRFYMLLVSFTCFIIIFLENFVGQMRF